MKGIGIDINNNPAVGKPRGRGVVPHFDRVTPNPLAGDAAACALSERFQAA